MAAKPSGKRKGSGGEPRAEVFAALSPSSRRALAVAEEARRLLAEPEVTAAHLLLGLFEKDPGPTRRALGATRTGEPELERLLELPVEKLLQEVWNRPLELRSLPELARDAQRVLDGADALRRREGGDRLRTRDLLEALLALEDLPLVQELHSRGVRLDPASPDADREEDDAEPSAQAAQVAGPEPSAGSPKEATASAGSVEDGAEQAQSSSAAEDDRPRANIVRSLLEVGPTSVALVDSLGAWDVPDVDAVVLPCHEGTFRGVVERWIGKDRVERLESELFSVLGPSGPFGIDAPQLVELSAEAHALLGVAGPRTIVAVTAVGPEGVDYDRSVKALAELVGERADLRRLAVPITGTVAGPDDLDAFLRALVANAPAAGLREIVLTDASPRDLLRLESLLPELREAAASWVGAPERSGLQADAVRGRDGRTLAEQDSLGMREQAEVFARAVVDAEFRPPLAIGLFGDWGCGKTFFMGLLREEVERLTRLGDARYVSRAVQIDFNAWHYVDADLWATLATRIFDGLVEPLRRQRGDRDPATTRRELRRRIHSSEAERSEAEADQARARGEREQATRELERLHAARAEEAAQGRQMQLERLWTEFREEPLYVELRSRLAAAAEVSGLDRMIHSTQDLDRVRARLEELRSVGGGFALAARGLLSGGHLVGTVALLAAVAGLWWGAPFVAGFLAANGLDAGLAAIAARVTQVATVLGAVVAKASGIVRELHGALESVRRAQARVAELERTDRVPTPAELAGMDEAQRARWTAELALRERAAALDAEIETASRKAAEAERRIGEAEAEIQRIDAGGLVYDFLAERGADARYRDRLGIISLVRHDFERLGVLLRDWTAHGSRSAATPEEQRPIERILLYVDDLDRCPPHRVVEVLQAVHLLLAFDLFIVVVGVDARWLERSLQDTYDPVTGSNGRAPRHAFDAHNYLEKIFQIPFALGGLTSDGFRSLVDDLVVTRAEQREREAARRAAEAARVAAEEARAAQAGSDDDGGTTGAQGAASTGADAGAADGGTAERISAGATGQESDAERDGGDDAGADSGGGALDLAPEPLVLEDWEAIFLRALAPFVGTPRLAKRMLNVYRLLRVRAGRLGPAEFLSRAEGHYRAAALLLAIQIGCPDAASRIVRALGDVSPSDERDWWTFLAELAEDPLLEPGPKLHEGVRAELVRVRDGCERVAAELAEDETGITLCESLAPYVRWAGEVGRYSFRWAAPGATAPERAETREREGNAVGATAPAAGAPPA